jgi:hypothetical protein
MRQWLSEAGFPNVTHETVSLDCTGPSVTAFCEGLIDGNPVVLELRELGEGAVDDARGELEKRFVAAYGDAPFKMNMQAIVFEAKK